MSERDISMNILFYHCFSGISGDMHLGALIELGLPPDYLTRELIKLPLAHYELKITREQRKGITGTRVEVIFEDHHHKSDHGDHSTEKKLRQGEDHHVHHQHLSYSTIIELINDSSLNENVQTISKRIFHVLAQAEATIHNQPIEEVHFHEVGAVDSIIDIVGAAIGIDYLQPDKIISSPPELGSGVVTCAHGIFPVPAPATLEILKGKPVTIGTIPFEATTPTGAALLSALVDEFTETLRCLPKKTGYGIGLRDYDLPNVLRACYCSSCCK